MSRQVAVDAIRQKNRSQVLCCWHNRRNQASEGLGAGLSENEDDGDGAGLMVVAEGTGGMGNEERGSETGVVQEFEGTATAQRGDSEEARRSLRWTNHSGSQSIPTAIVCTYTLRNCACRNSQAGLGKEHSPGISIANQYGYPYQATALQLQAT